MEEWIVRSSCWWKQEGLFRRGSNEFGKWGYILDDAQLVFRDGEVSGGPISALILGTKTGEADLIVPFVWFRRSTIFLLLISVPRIYRALNWPESGFLRARRLRWLLLPCWELESLRAKYFLGWNTSAWSKGKCQSIFSWWELTSFRAREIKSCACQWLSYWSKLMF